MKYPWPIDVAYKVNSGAVHELKIGDRAAQEEKMQEGKDELILWTNKHSQEPHLEVLVATPRLETTFEQISGHASGGKQAARRGAGGTCDAARVRQPQTGEAVAVSLMRIAVSHPVHDSGRLAVDQTYDQPEEMLKAISDREINRYCASVQVDGLIGGERAAIEQALHKAIQTRADEAKLGVKIVFLGLQGVHPPESTAQDFQDVVGAEQKKAATIRSAEAEYNKKLSEVAGDVALAEDYRRPPFRRSTVLDAGTGPDSPAGRAAGRTQRAVLRECRGTASAGWGQGRPRSAKTPRPERWKTENDARRGPSRSCRRSAANNAAPQVYRTRKILEALIAAGTRCESTSSPATARCSSTCRTR